MGMTSYERIMAALNHKNPDRPPINYIATPEMTDKLKKHLKIESDEELLRNLGADFRFINPKYVGPKEFIGEEGFGSNVAVKDIWGVEWGPIRNKFATYYEITSHPLGHVKTTKEVKEYSWPSIDWFDFSNLKEEINRINDIERRAIIFYAGDAFTTPWFIRGLERFLMDLIEYPEISEAISRKVMEFYQKLTVRAIEETGGQIDIFCSCGDIGTQRGMMLSAQVWRKHIKPYSKQLIKPFKEMGFKTMYHSCGSIVPVIEDLIEMGLDILEPVQPKAEGMNPEFLKSNFGSRLSFHGGIDEQELLPMGTPEDVVKEVLRIIDILGKDGGYIMCSSHALQPDTPVENALAMFRTAREYRY